MSERTYTLTSYDQKEIIVNSYKEYLVAIEINKLMNDKNSYEAKIKGAQENLDEINEKLADLKK